MPQGKRQRQPGETKAATKAVGKKKAAKQPKKAAAKRTVLSRLVSPFKRLLTRVRPGKGKGKAGSGRARLLPAGGQKRTLAQWKELRRRTAAEVKAHLAEQQPVPAIKKLTRALLEDPQHPAYHELLKKAVEQRRQRRLKPGQQDPWAELPKDLRQEALQLEAFSAYVNELEQLFDKAGIPPLSAPPPPDQRQKGERAKPKRRKTQA